MGVPLVPSRKAHTHSGRAVRCKPPRFQCLSRAQLQEVFHFHPSRSPLRNQLIHKNRNLFCILQPQKQPLKMIKYTNQFLTKLEDLIAESDYVLRYEKGNFKSGYCLLKEQKIMIINKFFTTEGKINAVLDILKNVELDGSKFTEKSQKLYEELTQAEAKAA
jgi:hypothetical protein